MRNAGLLGLFSAVLLTGCGERSPDGTGAWVVTLDQRGLSVQHGSTRLTPAPLPGATFGVGFAHRETTSEMTLGFHSFTETGEPWLEGVELAASEELGPGTLRLKLRARAADAARLGVALACEVDASGHAERFLGLGSQVLIDEHGRRVPVWTSEQGIGKLDGVSHQGFGIAGDINDAYYPLPIVYSSRGYAVVTLGSDRVVHDFCKSDPQVHAIETFGSELDLVIVVGTPLELVERVTAVTGRPPRPPAWTFGPWMDAVGGAARVREEARLLRQHGVAASALWSEDWAGGGLDGTGFRLAYDWDIDRTLYPDAEQLAAELHAQGFRWLAYFNTFVQAEGPQFAQAMQDGYLLETDDGAPYLSPSPRLTDAGQVDLENPAARAWMSGYLQEALRLGFDGWMADYGEWVPWDARTLGGARACHNCYPDLWATLNREALEAARPGGDALFFVRSGHLGTAKEAPVVWGGDQNTDWDALDGIGSVIPIGLGLGLGGASTFGSDIAGYSNLASDPSTKELFFRWVALGALTPVMRTHHGNAADKNWRWDRDAETIAHFVKYAGLHNRLFPLWDALSKVASDTGVPIMRPGWLHHAGDAAVAFASDQFLLGDGLLVAPVLVEGATSRDVALPKGRWYDFWTGAALEGGGVRAVAAAIGDLPLFARAGAIVPLLPATVMTLAPGGDGSVPALDPALPELEVRVYLGADGRFVLADGTAITLRSKAEDAAGAPVDVEGASPTVAVGSATVEIAGTTARRWHLVPVGR
jgi:alpha-glucosidase (family GH31 glycosyl hydrolase)